MRESIKNYNIIIVYIRLTERKMAEMAILPSFTAEQKLLMKKALYYDFMLFNRNNKPFNAFLRESGLKNSMYSYTPKKNKDGYTDPFSSNIGVSRYEINLHTDLSPPNRFIPDENENLVLILESLNNAELVDKRVVFNPDTSE